MYNVKFFLNVLFLVIILLHFVELFCCFVFSVRVRLTIDAKFNYCVIAVGQSILLATR